MLTTTKRNAPWTYSLNPRKRTSRRAYTARPVLYRPRMFSRGEWKFTDVTVNTDINTTPTITLLNGLVPGNSASQRVGNKVTIKSLEMRARVQTTAATGVEQFCRWFIVLDRQANGAAPAAITDILSANSVTSLRNLENRKRFKIIVDKAFPMGATSVSTGTVTSRMYKVYIKFRRPILVEFNNGVAGTIADIVSNSLHLCTLGNVVAGNTDANLITTVRLRYTDM